MHACDSSTKVHVFQYLYWPSRVCLKPSRVLQCEVLPDGLKVAGTCAENMSFRHTPPGTPNLAPRTMNGVPKTHVFGTGIGGLLDELPAFHA